MPSSPAAIPATCVPWGSVASKALLLFLSRTGPGKTRATITLLVVSFASPRGKPAGAVKPLGSRNGLDGSTPVSTTPIFIPCPLSLAAACSSVAWITDGPRSIVRV